MKLTDELEIKIETVIKKTVEKINAHYKINMPIPPVYYDLKGTTAGVAKYASMSIHLNTKLLLDNIEDFLISTVPHEVCHIGVMYKAQKEGKGVPKAHGAEWKLMMHVVGVPARRCHSYDVTEVKKKVTQYGYTCNCPKEVLVGVKIHGKIKKGYIYKCKKCKTVLKNGQLVLQLGFRTASPNGTTKIREEDFE